MLVPVVLLTDYELTEDDYSKRLSHEDFMGVNLTAVERAVARLLDPRQEAVVVSAHHPLSRHKQLLAALWKARRTRSEPVLDGAHDGAPPCADNTQREREGGREAGQLFCHPFLLNAANIASKPTKNNNALALSSRPTTPCSLSLSPPCPRWRRVAGARLGYHAATHASVDAAALLEELALAADTLTHGLVGARCCWRGGGGERERGRGKEDRGGEGSPPLRRRSTMPTTTTTTTITTTTTTTTTTHTHKTTPQAPPTRCRATAPTPWSSCTTAARASCPSSCSRSRARPTT